MDEINYAELDPGIRDTVRLLEKEGFVPCDSGDGVSKDPGLFASGEALPFPHVFSVCSPEQMVSESHRMARVLGSSWEVEATYDPHSCVATLAAFHKGPARGH